MKSKHFPISFIILVAFILSFAGCHAMNKTASSINQSTAGLSSSTAISMTTTSTPVSTTGSQPATTMPSTAAPTNIPTGVYDHETALKQAKYYQDLADYELGIANDDRDKAQREPSMYNFYMNAYDEAMNLYNTYLEQAKAWLYLAAMTEGKS